jgi:hypothetical protein
MSLRKRKKLSKHSLIVVVVVINDETTIRGTAMMIPKIINNAKPKARQ